MADPTPEKTPLDAWRDTSSVLKEMAHYSQSNIEKLAALWIEFDGDKKFAELAELANAALASQNAFQERISALIDKHDAEGAKLSAP